MPEKDSRESTWLLLDRGIDSATALKLTKEERNTAFVADVEAWRVQNPRGPAKIEGRDRSRGLQ
jgi:hypothetical protein